MAATSRGLRVAASPAILTLAFFTFLQIGRAPEIFVSLMPLRLMLITGLITLGCAAILPRGRWLTPWAEPQVKLVLALFALAALTVPISIWPRQSFEFVVYDFSKLIVFFLLVVYCTRSAADTRRIIWGVVAGIALIQFAILAGYGGLSSRGGETLIIKDDVRAWVTGTYDPNDIAFMMGCVLPLAFFLYTGSKGLGRIVSGAIALLAVVVSIRTVSRGGFVTLLIIGAILMLKSPSRGLFGRWGLAALAVTLFLAFGSAFFWERISTIWGSHGSLVTDYEAGGIWSARWNDWKSALGIMVANFPLGVGGGAYTTAEGLSHGGGGKWDAAHNSFLEVGAELGPVGLVIFIMLLYRGVRNCRVFLKAAEKNPELGSLTWLAHGLEASLYGYIIGGFSLSQGYAPILYLLIALSTVLRRLRVSMEKASA
jgi:putative inorganic carbon (HCO3(-)) transporter